jgi:hypothetical protein
LLVGCEPSFHDGAVAGMMAGMHPWIGLSGDVRLGVLTEWVTPELVIMDRGFPGGALWNAYTQAGAHLLIRARSTVAARPVKVLDEGAHTPPRDSSVVKVVKQRH